MRWSLLGALAVLFTGVALVAASVAEGGASVALFVIVPVVSGSSILFLAGVALLFAGFFLVLFAVTVSEEEEPAETEPTHPPSPSGAPGAAGGFVLIGPVPIVFGSWKGISRRSRTWLALVGAVLLIAACVAFLWFSR